MHYYKIEIRDIAGKGRGVFALEEIPAGAQIEIAPVIVMSEKDRLLLDQTLLHDYIFEWQPEGATLCCMALGYVPIYNHANNSNAEYVMHYETNEIAIHTVSVIAKGTEICINYNGDWDNNTPLWFKVV